MNKHMGGAYDGVSLSIKAAGTVGTAAAASGIGSVAAAIVGATAGLAIKVLSWLQANTQAGLSAVPIQYRSAIENALSNHEWSLYDDAILDYVAHGDVQDRAAYHAGKYAAAVAPWWVARAFSAGFNYALGSSTDGNAKAWANFHDDLKALVGTSDVSHTVAQVVGVFAARQAAGLPTDKPLSAYGGVVNAMPQLGQTGSKTVSKSDGGGTAAAGSSGMLLFGALAIGALLLLKGRKS